MTQEMPWMHYIRMIKYNYVWLRMQYGKLRTKTDCHERCRIVSWRIRRPVRECVTWALDFGTKSLIVIFLFLGVLWLKSYIMCNCWPQHSVTVRFWYETPYCHFLFLGVLWLESYIMCISWRQHSVVIWWWGLWQARARKCYSNLEPN